MLASPAFTTMTQNMRLRNAAESILAGLNAARIQALQRNQAVEFLLINEDPDPDNVAGYVANTSGPGWAVRANTPDGFEFIEARSGVEGSNQSNASALNVKIDATSLPATKVITFNNIGRTDLGVNAQFDITNPVGGACKTAGGDEPMRCLRIVVTPGGRVRMCDPSVTVATDTRAC
jgi:type IV fimbrial biogenesis protein FimT